MQEIETWKPIPDFPDYSVSNMGRVLTEATGHIKEASLNQQGLLSVLLVHNTRQYRRSVALLVAHAYLEYPENGSFDTPIHLNGDRLDCRASNLAWRPRWFAIMYHKDLREPLVRRNLRYGYVNTRDGLRFETERDAATHYGVREHEVYMSANNQSPVFPTWDVFRFDD